MKTTILFVIVAVCVSAQAPVGSGIQQPGGSGSGCSGQSSSACPFVQTNTTTTQQTLGGILAPYINGNPSVDGTPAPTFVAPAAWSGTTAYVPGQYVLSGGSYYVSTYPGTNQQPAAGTIPYYWEALPYTQAPTCITQFDVAFMTAHGMAAQTGVQQNLHLGSGGTYLTCIGAYWGASTVGPVSITGEGASFFGGGNREYVSTIKSNNANIPYVLYHPSIAGGVSGLSNIHLTNFLVDGNNQSKLWLLSAMAGLRIDDLAGLNPYDSAGTTPWSIGDVSPGGKYALVADLSINHMNAAGKTGNGPASWASTTITDGTGAITFNSGGTYINQPGEFAYYLKGAETCTTVPVYQISTSGTGPYAVSNVVRSSAGSGCVGLQLIITDTQNFKTGGLIVAEDGTVNDVRNWNLGFAYGMEVYGPDIKIYYAHPLGSPVCALDHYGAVFNVADFDSCSAYGLEITGEQGQTTVQNALFEWNDQTHYIGAGNYMALAAAVNPIIQGSTCISGLYQEGGGYNFWTEGATGSHAAVSGQIIQNNTNCDGSNTPFANWFATYSVQPAIRSGSASNTDLSGELSFSTATAATYTFLETYTSHPECSVTPQFNAALQPWVTYTGTTSFTINFATAVTGTVTYACSGRN